MKSLLDTTFSTVKWLMILGLMVFISFSVNSGVIIFSENPALSLLITSAILLFALAIQIVIFKNAELTIFSFITFLLNGMIITGVESCFKLNINRVTLYPVVFLTAFVISTLVMYWLFQQKKKKHPGIFHPVIQYLVALILTAGLLSLFWIDQFAMKIAGFVLVSCSVLFLVTINVERVLYTAFFQGRMKRGINPLTFLQIIETLWTYFILVLGSMVVGIIGVVLYGMIFIGLESRKLILHYLIMYYCRFFIWIIPLRTRFVNAPAEDFTKAAIVICNHQSLIDMPLLFRLYPKLIILTNEWVYNSPIFGHISKLADYYNVSSGIDEVMDKLKDRVQAGYSIIIFPEGTRASANEIQRFHKGAFYIAEKLQLDIIPILQYGTGDVLRKGEFWGSPNIIIQRIYDRIDINDAGYGVNYAKRPKQVRKYLAGEYSKLKDQHTTLTRTRKEEALCFP